MPPDHSARRGAVSRKLDQISASGIRRFFETEGVISLGVGQPDFVTPNAVRQAAIRSLEDGETGYTSNWGIMELRAEIARHLERLYGVSYDPETEIIVTTGVSEGLNVAMQSVLDNDDEVLSPEPSYVAYMPNVVFAGGRFVSVPTSNIDGFGVDAHALAAHVSPQTKAILIGNPCNPTGLEMDVRTLRNIARAADQHDLFVISDEIYDRLVYGTSHTCFPTLPGMRDRTILLGGFSKYYAMTGFRLGYLCAPAFLAEAIMRVHQYVMMSAPTAAQYAALEALRHGEEDARGMLAEYARRRELVIRSCDQIGLSLVEPNGGFYAFPNVESTGMDDETFADRLITEEKVALIPGSIFGKSGINHVRICYATDYEVLEEAFSRIGRFVKRHAANGHSPK